MRTLATILSLAMLSLAGMQPAAADAVDLRGKKGVVDPGYLKQSDPKPPRVERTAPPPPPVTQRAPSNPKFDVSKSSGGVSGIPPNGGDLPPPRPRTIPDRRFFAPAQGVRR